MAWKTCNRFPAPSSSSCEGLSRTTDHSRRIGETSSIRAAAGCSDGVQGGASDSGAGSPAAPLLSDCAGSSVAAPRARPRRRQRTRTPRPIPRKPARVLPSGSGVLLRAFRVLLAREVDVRRLAVLARPSARTGNSGPRESRAGSGIHRIERGPSSSGGRTIRSNRSLPDLVLRTRLAGRSRCESANLVAQGRGHQPVRWRLDFDSSTTRHGALAQRRTSGSDGRAVSDGRRDPARRRNCSASSNISTGWIFRLSERRALRPESLDLARTNATEAGRQDDASLSGRDGGHRTCTPLWRPK